jgi:signal transduction histidine kinase
MSSIAALAFSYLNITKYTKSLARLVFVGLVLIFSLQNNLAFGEKEYYNPSLEVLIVENDTATLEEILEMPQKFVFQKTGGVIFYGGFSRKEHWFRFEVPAIPTATGYSVMQIQPATLDDVEIYVQNDNGQFEVQRGGDMVPLSLQIERIRPLSSNHFYYHSPQKPEFYYIKLRTESAVNLGISVYTPAQFLKKIINEYIFAAAYTTFFLTIILLNLIQGSWLKELTHRYYILHALAITAWFLATQGYLTNFFAAMPVSMNVISELSTYAIFFTGIIYYRYLFFDSFRIRVLDSYLYYSIAGIFLIAILISIFQLQFKFGSVFGYVLAIALAYFLLMIYEALYKIITSEGATRIEFKIIIAGAFFSLFAVSYALASFFGIIRFQSLDPLSFINLSNFASVICYQIATGIRIKKTERSRNHENGLKLLAIRNAEEQKSIITTQARFLSMIQHEIRTPLSVIRLATVMKNPSDNTKQYAKDAIESIDRIIERCAFADSLDSSKIIATMEPCNFTLILKNLIDRKFDNIPIDIFSDSEMFEVISDSELITIVFVNLIENAIKYSSADSRISIELKSIAKHGSLMKSFSIRNRVDHPEHIDTKRVFERYVRSPNSENISGSGLGLFIVKGLVESFYADITCSINEQYIELKICF